jgi:hypothetical protein
LIDQIISRARRHKITHSLTRQNFLLHSHSHALCARVTPLLSVGRSFVEIVEKTKERE